MTHLVFGLVLVALGVWGIVAWWGLFGLVMRGVVPFFLLVVGLVAIIAGYRRNSLGLGRRSAADVFPAEPTAVAGDAPSSTADPN
jgi:hypothetical protein